MAKITFRADDDLVERLETFDASKSEVMRDALRAYLDDAESADGGTTVTAPSDEGTLDDAIAERVDAIIEDRLDAHLEERGVTDAGRDDTDTDVDVTISLDGVTAQESGAADSGRATVERESAPTGDDAAPAPTETCNKCGGDVAESDVYCPNCGEKVSHRAFCECGDEIRSDWAFCPGCGRRTAAADVLDGT